jgi:hypothetical protein
MGDSVNGTQMEQMEQMGDSANEMSIEQSDSVNGTQIDSQSEEEVSTSFPTEPQVPEAASESSIPSDVGGATSTNPTKALASPKDVEATSSSLQTFKLLVAQKDASKTDLSKKLINEIQQYQNNIPQIENQLKIAYSNPDIAGMTSTNISSLRNKLNNLTKVLANAHTIRGPTSTVPAQNINGSRVAYIANMPQPDLIATPPKVVTLSDLENLHKRINQESLKLANLRSKSATIQARQNQLDEMAANLVNIITEVKRGNLALEDVPITKEDAINFLQALNTNTKTLPSLHIPGGVEQKTMKQVDTVDQSNVVHQLLENVKHLKWSLQLNVSYDPLIHKLMTIEESLLNLTIQNSKVPDNVFLSIQNEVSKINQQLNNIQPPRQSDIPQTDYRIAKNDNRFVSSPEYPTLSNLQNIQYTGFTNTKNTFPIPTRNPDVYVRPGAPMTDKQIAHRGSSSAFDDSLVGGPDWKQRSQDLCRQVAAANLGEPRNFGCINNPSEVSPNYSWKGNYKMVCNRLGDTWGAWYPDMFGCPKYDPQHRYKGGM